MSSPTLISANGATYQVSNASYSLALTAQSGECWISATDSTTGSTLFSGVLSSGQSHTVAATGPVTVIAGAPAAFAATVNGVSVALLFRLPGALHAQVPDAGCRRHEHRQRRHRFDDHDDVEQRGLLAQPSWRLPRASSRKASTSASSFHAP